MSTSSPSNVPSSSAPPDAKGPPPGSLPGLPTDNLGPDTLITIWTFFAVAAIFIGLRVYCKTAKHSRLFLDDVVLIAAGAALLGCCITSTFGVSYGLGRHYYMLSLQNVNNLALMANISITLAICAQCWSKVSFALTVMRISTGWQRYFLWFAIISMNIFFCVGCLTVWVNCVPLKKAWTPLMEGTCWDPLIAVHFAIFVSAWSGFMDLCFVALAWRVIMGLQMKKRERVGVAIAMSMGVFAAIMAFVKCTYLPGIGSLDMAYNLAKLDIPGVAEPAICIIAASIPVLRALTKTFVKNMGKYYLFQGRSGFSPRRHGHSGQSGSGHGASNGIGGFGESYKMQGSEVTMKLTAPTDMFGQYSRTGDETAMTSLADPAPTVPPKFGIRKTTEYHVR